MKKTQDYDNVFKTLKTKHKRLFIPLINEAFGRNYPYDARIEVLSSEGYLTKGKSGKGKQIQERISDFLIKLGEEIFLLECQSYEDNSMAVRMAEYTFIAARQTAEWDAGYAVINLPNFTVLYIRKTAGTPEKTVIRVNFPDGQSVDYCSENMITEDFTREDIIGKKLFPLIPFYCKCHHNPYHKRK